MFNMYIIIFLKYPISTIIVCNKNYLIIPIIIPRKQLYSRNSAFIK